MRNCLKKEQDKKQVSKSAHLFLHPCTAPHVKPLVIARPVLKLAVAIRSPVPSAPLPKGGWHGAAVTGGFLPRTSCYVPVGDDDPVAVPKIFALPYGGRLKF